MSDHIILISCSNGKVRGGNADYNPNDSITAFLPSDIQQTVWQRRCTIADWIIAGQLEDRLRGDGKRRDSRYNIALRMGRTCAPNCLRHGRRTSILTLNENLMF